MTQTREDQIRRTRLARRSVVVLGAAGAVGTAVVLGVGTASTTASSTVTGDGSGTTTSGTAAQTGNQSGNQTGNQSGNQSGNQRSTTPLVSSGVGGSSHAKSSGS